MLTENLSASAVPRHSGFLFRKVLPDPTQTCCAAALPLPEINERQEKCLIRGM